GQLRLAEVQPPCDGQEEGGLALLGPQCPGEDPVVGADGAGAVGAAGGILVEGAGAPDGLAGAVDVGIVAGPDVVAVAGAVGQVVDVACQAPLEEPQIPGAVLGEGLQGLPVGHPVQADEGLGDGVLFDVASQAGDPLDKALLAAAGEAHGERDQDGLPEQPQLGSFHHTPPGPWLSDVPSVKVYPGGLFVNRLNLGVSARVLSKTQISRETTA